MPQIEPLTPELQKIAMEELGEVPDRIPQDLMALKTWIEQQPHLRARTDDQFLIQFLRGCKYSLEKAKVKIDLYFSMKTKYPQMLAVTDVDDARFKEIHNTGCFTLLPTPLNENGPRILFYQYNYDPDKMSIEDIYLPTSAMLELTLLNDPYAGIHGFVYIFDFEKLTARHLLQLTPSICKRVVTYLEKSLPLRVRGVYFINIPAAAQPILKFTISLCSEKIQKKMHVLGHGIKDLIKHIPLKYLPKDYGGENGLCSELTQEYIKVLEQYRDHFKENTKYGTDEHLRVGEKFDLDGLYGVGGSFRQLVVD
ncbi:alpha-tocopherol transfer protein-like [Musca domestica]|uniref:Alpha-tocopherol transfer protein-like n=1 Tax=Musca domestica TaxID=7370 RepID=A0A1I8M3E7_MUSDO|nr:alpha-tocopherol transfer protein-like [Musca domestica]